MSEKQREKKKRREKQKPFLHDKKIQQKKTIQKKEREGKRGKKSRGEEGRERVTEISNLCVTCRYQDTCEPNEKKCIERIVRHGGCNFCWSFL